MPAIEPILGTIADIKGVRFAVEQALYEHKSPNAYANIDQYAHRDSWNRIHVHGPNTAVDHQAEKEKDGKALYSQDPSTL